MLNKLVVIGLGGFVGAILRYLLSGWALSRFGTRLPYGTLFVNALGSLILGFILIYGTEVVLMNPSMRLFIAT